MAEKTSGALKLYKVTVKQENVHGYMEYNVIAEDAISAWDKLKSCTNGIILVVSIQLLNDEIDVL